MKREHLVLTGGIAAHLLFLFYLGCLHYTPLGYVGILRHTFTGEVVLDHPGWNLTPPWIRVAKVDARPMRVCITSAGRGYSCKLVQFQPSAVQEFVKTEGFRYYWLANRVSFNFGYDDEYRGVRDIMRGYAYSPHRYAFLVVKDEYQEEPTP